MRLVWSHLARADREQIYSYIEADSPIAAALVDERISQSLSFLKQFPEIGRAGRVPGTRELVVRRTPFIAVYTATDETIRILRILHGAQRWP